jgi:hypothetical protein
MSGFRKRKGNLLRNESQMDYKLELDSLSKHLDADRTHDNKQTDTIGLRMSLQNQHTLVFMLQRYITCSNIPKVSTKHERENGTHVNRISST